MYLQVLKNLCLNPYFNGKYFLSVMNVKVEKVKGLS